MAVIGLGYIGLPTAAVLATHGFDVVGVDINPSTVDAVNRGKVPFVEPDLEISVAGAVARGRLRAQSAPPDADVYVVAVPTPFLAGRSADLSFIMDAADAIAPMLRGGELVILESTSPPGTTRLLADRLVSARPDLSFDGPDPAVAIHVAHCPERVLPGRIMVELVTNDRIVGGLTAEATARASALYAVFCKGKILETDAETAELAKLVENAYRDVNIAFANELSLICDKLDVDVWGLIRLANHHPRVDILEPGPGVGGHCIAVDPWFLVSAAPEDARLVRTARNVNDSMPGHVAERVVRAVKETEAVRVVMLGLSYKADIDDLRNSPAVAVVEHVASRLTGIVIDVVEPNVDALPSSLALCPNVSLVTSAEAEKDDVVVLLVNHAQFASLGAEIRSRNIIDMRGAWRASA
ncbi:UDP-N-acetyl-D-mannosamine dehydrogenase [Sanguibacter suaedae]|uniref:UDP-N-acetyl-D-mannosamine dehydrogenase n=1 Tax=Sanguibacter suaedae TaxID=2795737 RepID=UPI0027DAD765|nr:UDP-N-acetyl-D-mannosamine dehydrogenase [Sanguibacter suaedae]